MPNYSVLPVVGTFCFDDGKYASVIVTLMMLCCYLSRQPNIGLGTRMTPSQQALWQNTEREDDGKNDPDHPAPTGC